MTRNLPALLLASTSPRRRELITLMGRPFQAVSVDVDETPQTTERPEDLVRRLCRAKALAGQALDPSALVVAADTVVLLEVGSAAGLPVGANPCGGECVVLGKPGSREDAAQMLRMLRGRDHVVYSGIDIVWDKREILQVAKTRVWMRDYTDTEIETYVASGDPLDKAAAYAVQNAQFRPVARVEGCYANVMGLPLCHLYRALTALGVPLDPPDRACQNHLEIACPVAQEILMDNSGYSV